METGERHAPRRGHVATALAVSAEPTSTAFIPFARRSPERVDRTPLARSPDAPEVRRGRSNSPGTDASRRSPRISLASCRRGNRSSLKWSPPPQWRRGPARAQPERFVVAVLRGRSTTSEWHLCALSSASTDHCTRSALLISSAVLLSTTAVKIVVCADPLSSGALSFGQFDRVDDAYRREKQASAGWSRSKRLVLVHGKLDRLPEFAKKPFNRNVDVSRETDA